MAYDSTVDTLLHIKRVNELMSMAAEELLRRARVHDESKLLSPEKELFDKLTPLLAGSKYMSEEYMGFLKELKPALDHHYANNPHHPEHHHDGVNGMGLFDVMEMFFDWKAASERHADGDIYDSISKNTDRFKIGPQLNSILINTARSLNY